MPFNNEIKLDDYTIGSEQFRISQTFEFFFGISSFSLSIVTRRLLLIKLYLTRIWKRKGTRSAYLRAPVNKLIRHVRPEQRKAIRPTNKQHAVTTTATTTKSLEKKKTVHLKLNEQWVSYNCSTGLMPYNGVNKYAAHNQFEFLFSIAFPFKPLRKFIFCVCLFQSRWKAID